MPSTYRLRPKRVPTQIVPVMSSRIDVVAPSGTPLRYSEIGNLSVFEATDAAGTAANPNAAVTGRREDRDHTLVKPGTVCNRLGIDESHTIETNKITAHAKPEISGLVLRNRSKGSRKEPITRVPGNPRVVMQLIVDDSVRSDRAGNRCQQCGDECNGAGGHRPLA